MKQYFLTFSIFLFVCCAKQKDNLTNQLVFNGNIDTIKIDTTNFIQAKHIISNLKIIKLETTSSILIGGIDKLLSVEDKIIIIDKRKAQNIFVFDTTGQYLNSIGKIGRGPTEYIGIDDVTLIPETNHIGVLDRGTKKIKIFDLKGKFIRSEDTPFYLNNIEYLNQHQKIGSLIGRYPNGTEKYSGYSLFTFDKNWEIINYAFKDPFKPNFKFTSINTLKKYNNHIFYTPPFENLICEIDQNGINNIYKINFLGKEIPKYKLLNTSDQEFSHLLTQYKYFDGIFCDLKNFLILKTVNKQREETFFYNKKNQQTYFLNNLITNPLENYFHKADLQINDSTIIAPVSASQIYREKEWILSFTVAKPGETKINQHINELLHNLTENDNPILFLYSRKSYEK